MPDSVRAAATLDDVVALVGSDLVPVYLAGPSQVHSLSLHEPSSIERVPSGCLVLAVGYGPGDPRLEQLLDEAGQANAAGVIVKPSSMEAADLRGAAARHRVNALFAAQSADWLRLASLIRSARAISAVDPIAGVRVGDLFAFSNALALTAGGAVGIVDPTGEVLAFSTLPDQPLDDLRRRLTLLMQETESPATDPTYQQLYATVGCVYLPGRAGVFARIAVAVRSDAEILGTIWVLVPDPSRRDQAERALADFVDAAVIHLYHARSRLDVEKSRHASLLQGLLRGDNVASSARALRIDTRAWFRLALLISGGDTESPVSRRQLSGVWNWLQITHPTAVMTDVDSQLVVLFSGPDVTSDWPRIEDSLRSVLRRFDLRRSLISFATSLATSSPAQLQTEFERLVKLGRISAKLPGSGYEPVIRMEEHWPRVELAAMAEHYAANDAGRLRIIDEIRQADMTRGSELWPTIAAYVHSNGSHAKAASLLNVHQNTVRYRVERLKETHGLDLTDSATLVWLAVQTHHLNA